MDDRATGGELRGTCEYATRRQRCEHLVKQLCEHLVKQLPIRGAILLCADEESRCAYKFDKLNTNTDGVYVLWLTMFASLLASAVLLVH